MMKFRKKPMIVEARRLTHHAFKENLNERIPGVEYDIQWMCAFIETPEGRVRVNLGDWILIDANGEKSACKPHIFEKTYEHIEEPSTVTDSQYMNFGEALQQLKAGKKVARKGWNGKGMWIALTSGSEIPVSKARAGAADHLAQELGRETNPYAEIKICSHIDMRAADGSLVIGWLASQTDMLAEDWVVVE